MFTLLYALEGMGSIQSFVTLPTWSLNPWEEFWILPKPVEIHIL